MFDSNRILLVDSDKAFRRMVGKLIRRHHPAASVSEARGREDAMQQIKRHRPGLIVTEIDLRGRRSLDLLKNIQAVHPEGVIAVLTSFDLPEYREAATQSGAQYFISKSAPSGPAILEMVANELAPPNPPTR
jgi:DNA-binding NarL/FixJ family response regulator